MAALPNSEPTPETEISRTVSQKNLDFDNVQVDSDTGMIIHTLRSRETLQGLALMYHVTVQEIKKINKIFNEQSLLLKKQILIPITVDQLKEKSSEKKSTEKEGMVHYIVSTTIF